MASGTTLHAKLDDSPANIGAMLASSSIESYAPVPGLLPINTHLPSVAEYESHSSSGNSQLRAKASPQALEQQWPLCSHATDPKLLCQYR